MEKQMTKMTFVSVALIAARQDVVTKSCRVNAGVTRLLKGRRSLAHWLSDWRRLLCNRAGSAAARLNQSDIVFIFSIRWNRRKPCKGLVSA